jgi:T-complex protein 1 subunit beta
MDKKIGVGQPTRIENAKILVANTGKSVLDELKRMFVGNSFTVVSLTSCVCVSFSLHVAMDTDKIKIFGARVRVEATGKLAELERAERVRILLVFFGLFSFLFFSLWGFTC